MPALSTRQAARERILSMTVAALDRMIPADEKVALKGSLFADFEEQAYTVGNEVLAALMEERAKLERNAVVETAGRCPYCQSERTYLEKQVRQQEIRSPSGLVVIVQQDARCHACNGSFSPSAARLGAAHGSRADASGHSTRGTRSDHEHGRKGGASPQ